MLANFSPYFETFGRLIFRKIRIPFFLLILSIPPLGSGIFLFYEKQSLEAVQNRFFVAMKKAKTALERKARKELFLEQHSLPDPYFLDTEIESLSFLETEKALLKNWISHPAIPNKERLSERFEFLNSGENRLFFVEEEIQFSDFCKETLEKQRHPVQMDNHDLKKLLTLIEDIPLSNSRLKSRRPQLLVTDFTLKKMITPLQNEVFEVRVDLLKREFL